MPEPTQVGVFLASVTAKTAKATRPTRITATMAATMAAATAPPWDLASAEPPGMGGAPVSKRSSFSSSMRACLSSMNFSSSCYGGVEPALS